MRASANAQRSSRTLGAKSPRSGVSAAPSSAEAGPRDRGVDRPDFPLLLEDESTSKAFCGQNEAAFAQCLGRIFPGETEWTPAFASLVST